MTRLLLATRNAGKLRELRSLLEGERLELVGLGEFPHFGEVEETGKSFEENAALKATQAARDLDLWALGEDSGLEVDALGGRPGIHSARYAGEHGDDAANNAKLIEELRGVENRSARYVCSMVLASPGGRVIATTRGVCEGRISNTPSGVQGFGYDPYFWPEPAQCSMASLEPQSKDLISHRGQALRAMISLIRMHLGSESAVGSPEEPTVR